MNGGTTMNYEEKYKQALEKAKTFCKRWDSSGAANSELVLKEIKEIFPELKESEDERICREILELVSIAGNGNQFEEIKDWLEKQGKKLDAEDVFEWLRNNSTTFGAIGARWIKTENIIEQFKKDFGL